MSLESDNFRSPQRPTRQGAMSDYRIAKHALHEGAIVLVLMLSLCEVCQGLRQHQIGE